MKVNPRVQKLLWAVLSGIAAYALLLSYISRPHVLAATGFIFMAFLTIIWVKQSILTGGGGKKKAPAKKAPAPAKK